MVFTPSHSGGPGGASSDSEVKGGPAICSLPKELWWPGVREARGAPLPPSPSAVSSLAVGKSEHEFWGLARSGKSTTSPRLDI